MLHVAPSLQHAFVSVGPNKFKSIFMPPSLSSPLAHNTGRSSFPRCVTVALRLGWKVEMYAWRASMSICYPAFAALSRGRMTIRYLDEWRADVRATYNP